MTPANPPFNQPDGVCPVREQIITDEATGLTFQFELDEDGCTRFRIFGRALPCGNREIILNPEGRHTASGMILRGLTKPTWRTRMSGVGLP